MSQDTMMTRPIGDETGRSTGTDVGGAGAPRRRLGSWQVAPGATDHLQATLAVTPSHSSSARVAGTENTSAASTVPLAAAEQTARFTTAGASATLPLVNPLRATSPTPARSAPVSVPLAPAAEYVPTASDLTLPYSEREARREEWERQHAQASTVPLRGIAIATTAPVDDRHSRSTAPSPGEAATAPIRGGGSALDLTAPLAWGEATAPITASTGVFTIPVDGGSTAPIKATATAELSLLRQRLDDDPDDLDAALELALALHEAGDRDQASSILNALQAYYEANDEPEEAAQIRRLLGNLDTTDIGLTPTTDCRTAATVNIDAGQTTDISAATVNIGDSSPTGDTAPMGPALAGTTAHLGMRTASLERVPAGRDGRRRRSAAEMAVTELLPRQRLVLTDPIPLMDVLTVDGVELFPKAEEERAAGHLRTAIDTLNLAMAVSPAALGLWLRSAEIRIQLGHRRKAWTALEQLRRLSGVSTATVPLWMVERLLLHTIDPDVPALERGVALLIEADQHAHAATYASALIQLLHSRDQHDEAIACATRMAGMLPGHTQIALEGAILAVRHASHGEVIDLWEAGVANGADPDIAKASMAASVASASEDDHWRLLAESLELIRADSDSFCRDAYLRTATAAGNSPVLKAGRALVLHAIDDGRAEEALAAAAGDRSGSAIGRAAASIALAARLSSAGKGDEYVAAVRTTLTLMASESIRLQPDWRALTGVEPNIPELSTELGRALLDAGDAAGAVEILRVWHKGATQYAPLVRLLAEAYARTGQVGSALTILDELGMHHRKSGQLDDMAAVLRQMSRLAPTNVKVKSRLIDAYLQRGFVTEARAELVQRADLEEQAGQLTEACKSLQRAADLSWNLGFMNEAFGLYDRLLAIDPEDVGNRSALVNLYLQVGRLTEAAEHQRAVVDLAIRNGRRHEAIAALHQVIGLTPDDMTAYYQLGELLSAMGEYQQAEKVYRRIVLIMPDDAVAQAKATSMAALKEQMTAV